jgi:hypothetical protein
MSFYAVEIQLAGGPFVSRLLARKRNAQRWARHCAKTHQTRILYGDQIIPF